MRYLPVLFQLVLPTLLFAEVSLYRSNALGMALEEVPAVSRGKVLEGYTLTVERLPGSVVKSLREKGIEKKRWERSPGREAYYEEGALMRISLFDGSGRLREEQEYRGAEGMDELIRYRYSSSGFLSAVETLDPSGIMLHREEYLISPAGRLMRVRRLNAEGELMRFGLKSAGTRIQEEVLASSGTETVYSYDSEGRMAAQERWGEEGLLEREQWFYGKSPGRPERSEQSDLKGKTKRIRYYDAEGRVCRETMEGENRPAVEQRTAYDQKGRKASVVRVGPGGLEEWSYRYDPESGDLAEEEYRRRGQLEKKTIFESEDSRVEEIYREGLILIRAFLKDDRKVREEIFESGQLVRVRE